jgi:hypothetical protein
MKRVIAFEHEAKKKRSKFFDEKKRKRERERGKRSRAQRRCFKHRAFSRFNELKNFRHHHRPIPSLLSLYCARSHDEKKIP